MVEFYKILEGAYSSFQMMWPSFGSTEATVLGALLAVTVTHFYTQYREKIQSRKKFEAGRLILLHELASRVVHCVFDYDSPWRYFGHKDSKVERLLDGVVKFAPIDPVIYPVSVEVLAKLRPNTARAVIMFYNRLSAWKRDLADAELLLRENAQGEHRIPSSGMRRLSRRLGEVIDPAQKALKLLADEVGVSSDAIITDHFVEYYRFAADNREERINSWISGETKPLDFLGQLVDEARHLKQAEKRDS